MDNEALLDMVVTVKVARTRTKRLLTRFWLDQATLTVPLHNPTTFHDVLPELE